MNSQRLTQILLALLIATQIPGLIDRFQINYNSRPEAWDACQAWRKKGGKAFYGRGKSTKLRRCEEDAETKQVMGQVLGNLKTNDRITEQQLYTHDWKTFKRFRY